LLGRVGGKFGGGVGEHCSLVESGDCVVGVRRSALQASENDRRLIGSSFEFVHMSCTLSKIIRPIKIVPHLSTLVRYVVNT
jgi:hypothetical protein